MATGGVDPAGGLLSAKVESCVPVCRLMSGSPVLVVAGVRLKRTTCPVVASRPKILLSVNRFGAEAILPLTWLIFRTMPGGAGGGPGAPGLGTSTMLPAETNSPLIPAKLCTRNASLTYTFEELLLVLAVVLVPAVTVDGSSRSWICVSGPTELRFRLSIPEVTSMVPPAIRLNLGRLIVSSTGAPMPLRLVTA